jgi:hypothetical protein
MREWIKEKLETERDRGKKDKLMSELHQCYSKGGEESNEAI